jgi:ABC-2 type transport system permease protein
VARLDPLSYGVDGLRGTLVNGAHFGLFVDFTVLAVVAALFLAVGSYLFSKIEI